MDWMASIFASISGVRELERRDALDEALERRAIGAELVAQLRGLGVRLVEVDDFLPERLEIAAALVERDELRVRALRELVHLVEPAYAATRAPPASCSARRSA